jgi:hypothetical protein
MATQAAAASARPLVLEQEPEPQKGHEKRN